MSEVTPGEIIAGKFQIERVLGEGGMGYVVAARHLQLGQMVALKFMREDVMTDEYRSRFLREARNTVRLRSKHVSRVLDVGSLDGGVPYMVMEYLEGTDLSELLQKRGSFPPAEACDYIIQACEAIAEAHGYGIIHRDLKPANLFLTHGAGGEPVVKVLDFGVSKVLDLFEDASGDRHADSVVTKATDLLGSPSYMSPEQLMSSRDADAGSDVWSLGVILYRLISGKAPFLGNSLGDLIQNIVHGPMPNLRDVRPDIPAGLEQILWRALERDRTKRPDVIELARLLAPFAGPNAAPSLERIAILGPALLTAPPIPKSSATSFSGSRSSWSGPPLSQSRQGSTNATNATRGGRKEKTTASYLVWGLLSAVVIGSLVVVAAKIFKLPTGAPSAPSSSVAEPTPTPVPAVSTVAAVTTRPAEPPPTPTDPAALPPPGLLLGAPPPPFPSPPPQAQLPQGALPAPPQTGSRPALPPGVKPTAHPTTGAIHPKPRPPAPSPKPGLAPAPQPTPPSDIPPTRE